MATTEEITDYITVTAQGHPNFTTGEFKVEFESAVSRPPTLKEITEFQKLVLRIRNPEVAALNRAGNPAQNPLFEEMQNIKKKLETLEQQQKQTEALKLQVMFLSGQCDSEKIPKPITIAAGDIAGENDLWKRQKELNKVLEQLRLLETLLPGDALLEVRDYAKRIYIPVPAGGCTAEEMRMPYYTERLRIPFPLNTMSLLIEEYGKVLRAGTFKRLENYRDVSLGPPDYSHGIVKKKYDSKASSTEFVAEDNGWVFAKAWSVAQGVFFEINGCRIASTDHDQDGVFWAGNTGGYGSVFFPVRKGDKYKLAGGSYHTIVFYPCWKVVE